MRANFSIGAVTPTATAAAADTAVVEADTAAVEVVTAVAVDLAELAVEIECPTSAQA